MRSPTVTIEQLATTIQGELLGILQYLSVFGEPKVLGIVGSALTHIIALVGSALTHIIALEKSKL